MALKYDLVLKGGEVLDPAQKLRARRDVAFKDGKVAAVAEALPSEEAARVVDVAGKLVTPGLIDVHGHFAYKISPNRAEPDSANLPFGVTTAVDAGTCGWMNFPAFRSYIIERAETRLLSFLHISALGLQWGATGIPDLEDFRLAKEAESAMCIEENRDVLLGIKVRLTPNGTTEKNAVPALELGRRVADRSGSLMMVHVMESPLPLGQVFQHMKPGDIATHIFHGDTHQVLDEKGRIRPEVRQAYEGGIIFDTACMARHYSIPVCRAAIEQGILPHTISTDRVGNEVPPPSLDVSAHRAYAPGYYNLLQIMSVFHGLGMGLDQVIGCVTANAASVIGRGDLGSLKVGAAGDAAVLELEEGNFRFEDMLGDELSTDRAFACALTVKGGKVWGPSPKETGRGTGPR